jgi:hypothetical protein
MSFVLHFLLCWELSTCTKPLSFISFHARFQFSCWALISLCYQGKDLLLEKEEVFVGRYLFSHSHML